MTDPTGLIQDALMGAKLIAKALVPPRHHAAVGAFLRSLPRHGRRFFCPCCGRRFRRLLPFGLRRRLDAQCPWCLSLERHRLLILYLRERTDIYSSNLDVLHFAPEPILQKTLLGIPNLRYTSVDLESDLAQVKADIQSLPFADESFDVVLCSHVLEHVENDRRAILEIYRILRKGGWGILQVPLDPTRATTYEDPAIRSPAGRELAFGQSDHVRAYGRDYKSRLEAAGFHVTFDPFATSLGEDLAETFRVDRGEEIHFVRKGTD